MKIIDCHCHIYPDKIAAKASAAIGNFYNIPMTYDGTQEIMNRAESAADVDAEIVFSVATRPEQVSPINRFISQTVVASGGKLYGLGTVHPLSQNMEADIEEIISLGLLGIKIHPDFQKFALDDERFYPMYQLAEEKNLPILIHTGDKRYDYSNFNRFIPVLETFKKLKFIGAHFGGWSQWEQAPSFLAKYENLTVDCSSSLYALKREAAVKIIRAYGADRVMFGTDYPMWNPRTEIDRVIKLGLEESELQMIFHGTAERIFGI